MVAKPFKTIKEILRLKIVFQFLSKFSVSPGKVFCYWVVGPKKLSILKKNYNQKKIRDGQWAVCYTSLQSFMKCFHIRWLYNYGDLSLF